MLIEPQSVYAPLLVDGFHHHALLRTCRAIEYLDTRRIRNHQYRTTVS